MTLHNEDMFIVGISLLYWMTPSKRSARFVANQKMSFSTSSGLHDEKSFSSLVNFCSLIRRSTALKASFTFSTHCKEQLTHLLNTCTHACMHTHPQEILQYAE